jgi:hypothetical protein
MENGKVWGSIKITFGFIGFLFFAENLIIFFPPRISQRFVRQPASEQKGFLLGEGEKCKPLAMKENSSHTRGKIFSSSSPRWEKFSFITK